VACTQLCPSTACAWYTAVLHFAATILQWRCCELVGTVAWQPTLTPIATAPPPSLPTRPQDTARLCVKEEVSSTPFQGPHPESCQT
jgi:hypothetical protein